MFLHNSSTAPSQGTHLGHDLTSPSLTLSSMQTQGWEPALLLAASSSAEPWIIPLLTAFFHELNHGGGFSIEIL